MYAFTALIATVSATAAKFPRFDHLHADCQATATFDNTECSVLYAELDTEIRSWAVSAPDSGSYIVKEESASDYIWSTRLTGGKKYTDDQIFEFTQNGTTCDVAARSRSQSMSVYDYSTNYCNMWTPLSHVGGMTTFVANKKQCAYPASDPETTCLLY